MNLTEKYRPTSFAELAGQEQIKEKLSNTSLDELQHLMLVGRAGIGKTTTAHILKEKVYDDETAKQMNFKEMNSSNERGIDTVREEIKNFARTAPTNASRNILFLDEADSLTPDAQQALRRMMEKYSDNTVFILSGNYLDNFIDPLRSRCMLLEYNEVQPEDIEQRLEYICEQEGLEYSDEALQEIAKRSDGDVRSAINSLWFATEGSEVKTEKVVTAVDEMDDLIQQLSQAKYLSSKQEVKNLLRKGIEADKIISRLYEYLEQTDSLPDQAKAVWSEELADANWRMSRDTIPKLQLDRMVWKICKRTRELYE